MLRNLSSLSFPGLEGTEASACYIDSTTGVLQVRDLASYKLRGSACECRGKQVALDAARGLAYLHRKRIAWLDCKSSNVLLTK